MKVNAIHLLAEFYNCNFNQLNNSVEIERIVKEGTKFSGFTEVEFVVNNFDPVGISALLLIEESHIAVHTYPEANHLSLDIYHCINDKIPVYKLLHYFEKEFQPLRIKQIELSRGVSLAQNNINEIRDYSYSGKEVSYNIKNEIFSARTKNRKIDIIENEQYGRMLFLDNELKFSEYDYKRLIEFYSTVLKNFNFNKVAIFSGGDGILLKILLDSGYKNITVFENDKSVIDEVIKFLPEFYGFTFQENNSIIFESDLFKSDTIQTFDVFILELSFSTEQFTIKPREIFLREYFSQIYKLLNNEGKFIVKLKKYENEIIQNLTQEILSQFFNLIEDNSVTMFFPSFGSEFTLFTYIK